MSFPYKKTPQEITDVVITENAVKIWHYLTEKCVPQRMLPSYDCVGDIVGKGRNKLGNELQLISAYCESQELPDLTALVTSKTTGCPGEGFPARINHNYEREQVYKHKWQNVAVPTIQQLMEAYARKIKHAA